MAATATDPHIFVELIKPHTQAVWGKAQAIASVKEGHIRITYMACSDVAFQFGS